jgi:hypothetical protein
MATFKEAFREARKAGKKTFTWQGKSYTTELKEEVAARAPKTPVGAFRGQRSEGANEAPKKPSTAPEDGGMMGRLRKAGLTPSGASEVGAGKSALAALGMAGGAVGKLGGKAVSTAAKMEPRIGRPVTTRLDDAAAAFSKPRATEMTKSTAKEMPKAERVILKPVAKEAKRKAEEASRKKAMADEAKRIAEKKDDIVSKRMRSREEFAKGGSVTKGKK